MARVPAVPEPSATTNALPTPYERPFATPEGQGAGLGTGLEQAGQVAHGLAHEWAQKADTAMVLGAQTKAKAAFNSLIIDPTSGFASLRGKDAMDARDQTVEKFNQAIKDAGSDLTNDTQRMHYAQAAKSIQEQGYLHIAHHEGLEQERYMQAQFRGNVDQTMISMENPAIVGDPVALKTQIDSLFQAGIDEAKRRYGEKASRDAIQSVLTPELQKAALGGMEAATASGDPVVAKQAFDQLGKYMVTTHQRFYAGVVEKLATKATVEGNATALLRYSSESVPVPGGDPIPRVDAGKLAASLASLPPETPHLAEIQKAVEQREQVLGKVWSQSVGQVVSRVQTAGTDPATGAFSLSGPAVSSADREWLQRYAPDKLIALRGQDVRAQRQDNLADRQISAGNYNNLLAKMIDQTARKQTFGPMSPEEFKSSLLDEDAYPGGFSDQDTKRALQSFAKLKLDVGKLEEPVPTAVREILGAAFKNAPLAAKDYVGPLHDALQTFADQYKAAHNGVAPDGQTVRAYGEKELAKGSVTAAGTPDAWYNRMSVRRIDFQTKPDYAGQQFNPKEGGPAELRSASRLFRYSSDRKQRVPVDASGTPTGPIEDTP